MFDLQRAAAAASRVSKIQSYHPFGLIVCNDFSDRRLNLHFASTLLNKTCYDDLCEQSPHKC